MWGRLSASALTDAGGRPVLAVGIVEDIDERKLAEDALARSEEWFRGAFEQAPIGIALVGLDDRYLRVNRALCEMLGRSGEELVGRTWSEFTHPDDVVEGSEARIGRALEGGGERGRFDEEKRYVRADGREVWVLESVSLVRDAGGGPSHYVCHHVEVTDRRRAEEALRVSEQRFRAVTEQSPLSVHVFTAEGLSLRSNRSWDELWNLEEGETPEGTNLLEDEQMRTTGFLPYVEESIARGETMGTPPLRYDPAENGREGSVRWLEGCVYPLEDDGDAREMVLVIEDVTERVLAREELARSEERFRSMVSSASDMITVVEPDGTVLYESPADERVLGYAPEERVGENAFAYVHPKEVAAVREACEEVPRSGGPWAAEYRARHKDGTWR